MLKDTPFMTFWRGLNAMAREHNLPEPTYGPARQLWLVEQERKRSADLQRALDRIGLGRMLGETSAEERARLHGTDERDEREADVEAAERAAGRA